MLLFSSLLVMIIVAAIRVAIAFVIIITEHILVFPRLLMLYVIFFSTSNDNRA